MYDFFYEDFMHVFNISRHFQNKCRPLLWPDMGPNSSNAKSCESVSMNFRRLQKNDFQCCISIMYDQMQSVKKARLRNGRTLGMIKSVIATSVLGNMHKK